MRPLYKLKGVLAKAVGVHVVVGSKSLDLVHSQLRQLISDVLSARADTKHGEPAPQTVKER